MKYTIKLLPNDVNSVEASRMQIQDEAKDFVVRLLDDAVISYGKEPSGLSPKESSLAKDILTARFWGTLGHVDGFCNSNYNTTEKQAKLNEEARTWAKERFPELDLERILNIAVNQAILRPYNNTGWPGARKGHGILYRELVEKEDSIFSETVTEEFRKRLNNGRFWEALPDAKLYLNNGNGVYVVQDVLENHFDDLDVGFAPEGLELLKSTKDSCGKVLDHLDFQYIGETALGRYVEFIGKIDESKTVTSSDVEGLLNPYLSTVLSWDGEEESPYYHGEKDFDDIQRGRFQDKLQVPIVQRYVGSTDIQKHIAKILSDGVKYNSPNDCGQHSKLVNGVLDNIKNPKAAREVMVFMLKDLQSRDGIRFFQECEQSGHSLSRYMPWSV